MRITANLVKWSSRHRSRFHFVNSLLEALYTTSYHLATTSNRLYKKGFWSDISGTIEHTQTLTYLLPHAKLKQRNVVVTLIDLKNTFDKVHHQFLRKTLSFHNIPNSMI